MHFVWKDALTMSVNNPINIFLINSNIILYHVPFIKYLWTSEISLVSIGLGSTEKKLQFFLILFFHIINCKIFRNVT